jgi:hypothetical protein
MPNLVSFISWLVYSIIKTIVIVLNFENAPIPSVLINYDDLAPLSATVISGGGTFSSKVFGSLFEYKILSCPCYFSNPIS